MLEDPRRSGEKTAEMSVSDPKLHLKSQDRDGRQEEERGNTDGSVDPGEQPPGGAKERGSIRRQRIGNLEVTGARGEENSQPGVQLWCQALQGDGEQGRGRRIRCSEA